MFVGYATKYKGYLCYHVPTGKMFVSRHFIFDEQHFLYTDFFTTSPSNNVSSSHSSLSSTCSVPIVTTENIVVPFIPTHISQHAMSSIPASIAVTSSALDFSVASSSSQSIAAPVQGSPSIPVALDISSTIGSNTHDFTPDSLQVVFPTPPLNLHPMQTRSKSGIIKKKALLASIQDSGDIDLSLIELVNYKSAIKVPVWLTTMQEEINALHAQGTCSLVPLPANKNLVGCKRISKIKKHSNGSIARHKVRLVAKGFSQELGLDYGETFSLVVKPTTIRLVLAIAAHFNWPLRQLDVKNAFVHGVLQQEVYMSQPPGFVDSTNPNLVCKLHKSLYGLKQAPRAWNERFTRFLSSLGVEHTYSDSSLFVKLVGYEIVVLLLHVDDIIISGSAYDAILQVIHPLTAEFDIKDLGLLHYFLGIQITRTATGLFLSQSKYI